MLCTSKEMKRRPKAVLVNMVAFWVEKVFAFIGKANLSVPKVPAINGYGVHNLRDSYDGASDGMRQHADNNYVATT